MRTITTTTLTTITLGRITAGMTITADTATSMRPPVSAATPGVEQIHDLHIWSMSTTETALTAHLLMPGGHPGDSFLVDLCARLKERFGIGHATLQVETDPDTACLLESDQVV